MTRTCEAENDLQGSMCRCCTCLIQGQELWEQSSSSINDESAALLVGAFADVSHGRGTFVLACRLLRSRQRGRCAQMAASLPRLVGWQGEERRLCTGQVLSHSHVPADGRVRTSIKLACIYICYSGGLSVTNIVCTARGVGRVLK